MTRELTDALARFLASSRGLLGRSRPSAPPPAPEAAPPPEQPQQTGPPATQKGRQTP